VERFSARQLATGRRAGESVTFRSCFVTRGGYPPAKYWGFTPPAEKAEPIPLIPLYEDETMPGGF